MVRKRTLNMLPRQVAPISTKPMAYINVMQNTNSLHHGTKFVTRSKIVKNEPETRNNWSP